ncbi:MAG: VOC family protein [archaeon]
MKSVLLPYLAFNGNCHEAMAFYHSILGGKLVQQTFGEAMNETNPAIKNKIIHASLENDSVSLMASDCPPEQKAVFGNSVSLSLIGSDANQLTRFYNALSKGGKIEMALGKQFWGDTFGAFQDKYGIHWMVNITAEKK